MSAHSLDPRTNLPSTARTLDLGSLEAEFPILEEWLYVNHATISPWSRSVQRAVGEFGREFLEHGPANYARWMTVTGALREKLARLLGASDVSGISLLANTTEAINLVATGLPWEVGDEVILVAPDFPSMSLPWKRLEDQGVVLREVDTERAEDPESALLDCLNRRTRLLAVSSVHWGRGLRLDLGRLGRACRAAGVLTFVDGIQQVGALPLEVDRHGIDFVAAGAHKWQMGAEGLAVFYARETAREQLRLPRVGWRMFEEPFQFDEPGRAVTSCGRRFEPGSPNTLGIVALDAALGLLESQGPKQVSAAVLANAEFLAEGLSAVPGVTVLSRREPDRRSGIVTFAARGWAPADLCAALGERRLAAAARGGGVRVSPHFYQPKPHLERTLNTLEAVISGPKKH